MHFSRSLLILSVAFVAYHSTNTEAEASILSTTHLPPNRAQTTDARHAVKDEKEASDFAATKEERTVSFKQYLGMIPRFRSVKVPAFAKRIWKSVSAKDLKYRTNKLRKKRSANNYEFYT